MSAAAEKTTELFSRLDVAPAYIRLAEAIEREIASGKIAPGARIGTEMALCEQFGVNRSTVREGIRLLEQSGLLRRDKSRRLYASLPRYNNLATRVSRAMVLHQISFRELWEAALSLETASVEAAFRHGTAEDLERLRAHLAENRRHLEDPAKVIEMDTDFHALISQMGRNRALHLAREPVSLLFAPTLEIILRARPQAALRNLEAHEAVARALEARDEEGARLWMQRHINDWRRGFEMAGRSLDEPVERAFLERGSAIQSGPRT